MQSSYNNFLMSSYHQYLQPIQRKMFHQFSIKYKGIQSICFNQSAIFVLETFKLKKINSERTSNGSKGEISINCNQFEVDNCLKIYLLVFSIFFASHRYLFNEEYCGLFVPYLLGDFFFWIANYSNNGYNLFEHYYILPY